MTESSESPDAAVGFGLEVLDRLRSLALPEGDYAVFGSGPLLVRGIIVAVGDLDVLCRGNAWRAAQSVSTSSRVEEGVATVSVGPISFGTEWGLGDFDVDLLLDEAEVIDGLPFVRLEHVIAYKRLAGRPKDLVHLQLIADWMSSR
jgi:hypothetical protein